jgi:hypothetical protein
MTSTGSFHTNFSSQRVFKMNSFPGEGLRRMRLENAQANRGMLAAWELEGG